MRSINMYRKCDLVDALASEASEIIKQRNAHQ
jgi:hypothetical protein